jgi:hypothetical protein
MPEASQEELNAWFNDFKLSVDKIHRPCVGRKEEKFGRLGARDHPEGWVQRRERKECLRLKNKNIYLKPHASAAFLRGPPCKDCGMGGRGKGRRKRTGGRVETPHNGKGNHEKVCWAPPLTGNEYETRLKRHLKRRNASCRPAT